MQKKLITILIIALWLAADAACQGKTISSVRADLDGDGTMETISITCRTHKNGHPMGGEVIVSQIRRGALRPVWRQPRLNPWKLRIADVDGDGKQEIIVGVWKKSPKDPIMAKRVFVYGWNGARMMPKWLGSRLSRRFEDFEARNIDHDGLPELLALEVSPGKPRRVGIYRWKSFGFEWLGCVEATKWKELSK